MVGMDEVDGTGVKPPLLGLDIACFAARTGRTEKQRIEFCWKEIDWTALPRSILSEWNDVSHNAVQLRKWQQQQLIKTMRAM
jgi:hypothetical protein